MLGLEYQEEIVVLGLFVETGPYPQNMQSLFNF